MGSPRADCKCVLPLPQVFRKKFRGNRRTFCLQFGTVKNSEPTSTAFPNLYKMSGGTSTPFSRARLLFEPTSISFSRKSLQNEAAKQCLRGNYDFPTGSSTFSV